MFQVRIDLKRNQTDRNDDSNMCIAVFEAQKRVHLVGQWANDERFEGFRDDERCKLRMNGTLVRPERAEAHFGNIARA